MRKYHFNGPMDVPRFLILLIAFIVIAFAGSAILTVVAVVALVAIIPVILWERLLPLKRWAARSLGVKAKNWWNGFMNRKADDKVH
jgi:hypothetical protein